MRRSAALAIGVGAAVGAADATGQGGAALFVRACLDGSPGFDGAADAFADAGLERKQAGAEAGTGDPDRQVWRRPGTDALASTVAAISALSGPWGQGLACGVAETVPGALPDAAPPTLAAWGASLTGGEAPACIGSDGPTRSCRWFGRGDDHCLRLDWMATILPAATGATKRIRHYAFLTTAETTNACAHVARGGLE
ncbi:MAG: hypothetical protein ACFBSD_09280 [Paracoccaceae bacterium]